jgi:hypothetical protein
MQRHRFHCRLVAGDADAQGRIRPRKEFDVALARKMLREGATLQAIAEAHGMTDETVSRRLRSLGLGFMISDHVRRREVNSKGQLARIARERSGP